MGASALMLTRQRRGEVGADEGVSQKRNRILLETRINNASSSFTTRFKRCGVGMADNQFPRPEAHSIPVADIKVTGGKQEKVTHTMPIRYTEEDATEFAIPVKASTLRRCREELRSLQTNSFPWAEVLLGIACAGLGSIAGACAGDVVLNSGKGVCFYIIAPMMLVGCAVGYFFMRRNPIRESADVATSVLHELPDPDSMNK